MSSIDCDSSLRDLDFTFLEMNPFTLVKEEPYPLDMRGELDDTAAFKNFQKWGNIEFPLPFGKVLSPAEKFVHTLDDKIMQTSASLKFTVLNPKGRIWTMIAGGGARLHALFMLMLSVTWAMHQNLGIMQSIVGHQMKRKCCSMLESLLTYETTIVCFYIQGFFVLFSPCL